MHTLAYNYRRLLVVVALFTALVTSVAASPDATFAKSYQVGPVTIEAELNEDGSMDVKETRVFSFIESFTFAYQKFNTAPKLSLYSARNEPYLIENVKLCDEFECYKQLDERNATRFDEERPVDSFYVLDEAGTNLIKWFFRQNNGSRTFTLSYTVPNAVTLHNDVGELYWQWVGDEWEIDQGPVSVKLTLPPGSDPTALQAWAHADGNGRVAIPTAERVTFTIESVPMGSFFEGRVLVPLALFSGGAEGSSDRASITAEEDRFIADTIADIKRRQQFGSILQVVFLGLVAASIFVFFWRIVLFFKYGKDRLLPSVNQAERLWEPPSELEPAQVVQLIAGTQTIPMAAFTATLLSLVKDRYFKIVRSDQKEGFIFKSYRYFLVRGEARKKLEPIQSEVNDLLELIWSSEAKNIAVAGKEQDALSFDDMIAWFKAHASTSSVFFKETFPKMVLQKNLSDGYFDTVAHQKKNQGKQMGMQISLLLIGIIANYITNNN